MGALVRNSVYTYFLDYILKINNYYTFFTNIVEIPPFSSCIFITHYALDLCWFHGSMFILPRCGFHLVSRPFFRITNPWFDIKAKCLPHYRTITTDQMPSAPALQRSSQTGGGELIVLLIIRFIQVSGLNQIYCLTIGS